MSLLAVFLLCVSSCLSLSSSCIWEKSAAPTPTITMEMGSLDASITAACKVRAGQSGRQFDSSKLTTAPTFVLSRSFTTPSVMMSSTV
jgi:hypothetical protein